MSTMSTKSTNKRIHKRTNTKKKNNPNNLPPRYKAKTTQYVVIDDTEKRYIGEDDCTYKQLSKARLFKTEKAAYAYSSRTFAYKYLLGYKGVLYVICPVVLSVEFS